MLALLRIEVSPRDAGAHLVGSFSPHPSVWTGLMFARLSLGLVLLFALLFAGAQAMMGASTWPLWIAGGMALGQLAIWWASQVGQRLARAQMEALRGELDRAIAGWPLVG
jgi:hypothetical protein